MPSYHQNSIFVIGDGWLDPAALTSPHQWQIEPLRRDYPLNKLEYLGQPHAVIINIAASERFQPVTFSIAAEKVAQIRASYPAATVLVALPEDCLARDAVQFTRIGAADLLFPSYSAELIGHIISSHLSESQAISASKWHNKLMPHTAMGIIPAGLQAMMRPAVPSSADIYLSLFGATELYWGGRLVQLPPGTKLRSILAALLYEGHRGLTRQQLLRYFWPDNDADAAANNLGVQLSLLRRHLKAQSLKPINGVDAVQLILYKNERYSIHPDLRIQSDLARFQHDYELGREHRQRGQHDEAALAFARAASLYKGELMEDLCHENWTLYPRENLLERYLLLQQHVARWQLEKERHSEAIETLQRILYKDDCLEDVHQLLIQCYLKIGKTTLAQRQYEDCKRVLWDKMRRQPSFQMPMR